MTTKVSSRRFRAESVSTSACSNRSMTWLRRKIASARVLKVSAYSEPGMRIRVMLRSSNLKNDHESTKVRKRERRQENRVGEGSIHDLTLSSCLLSRFRTFVLS